MCSQSETLAFRSSQSGILNARYLWTGSKRWSCCYCYDFDFHAMCTRINVINARFFEFQVIPLLTCHSTPAPSSLNAFLLCSVILSKLASRYGAAKTAS